MWKFKPRVIKGTYVDVLMMIKLTWEKKSGSYHAKVDMTVCNTWELQMNKWTLKSTANSLLSKSTAAVKIDMALT